MTDASTAADSVRRAMPAGLRVWHLALLVLYAALAIVDIQDHGRSEPELIALAAAGFAAYALILGLAWRASRRLEERLGPVGRLAVFGVAMGVLFLVATIAYLVIEYLYLGGRL